VTSGIDRRLDLIAPLGTFAVMAPIDDLLIAGPKAGLEHPLSKIEAVARGGPDSILTFPGLADRLSLKVKTPLVANLTASTTRSNPTKKVLVASVETAVRAGCSAIACHINLGSAHESEMLRNTDGVRSDCDRLGMPLLLIVYPRTERNGEVDNYEELRSRKPDEYAAMVQHCLAVALNLGADLVKLQYPGSAAGLSVLVEQSCGVPLFLAGGPLVTGSDAIALAVESSRCGFRGVSYGRNLFGRSNPGDVLREIRSATAEAGG
jgi:DhnA family fructose-bisphosphate aldolase class Ia